LHSYDCPCVVSWPITGGNVDFIRWIESETAA
jgi:periplasmic divalent cation tolerance protein